jgi:formamidopyrimidine-DNA glycosylase
MPELPDVQVYKEYLDSTSLHHEVIRVDVSDDRILEGTSKRGLTRVVKGRAFQSARRHGKHLFVLLDQGEWLHVHFGMTGRLLYYKKGDKEPNHARVIFGFANGYHLAVVSQRLFGNLGLVNDPESFISEQKLGPDALDISQEKYVEILSDRRGFIKGALMNQSVIAGIGNIYSDEILFQARLLPDRRVGDLDASMLGDLWRTGRDVLKAAIEARADVDRMPSDWLLPHRSEGEKCPACGGKVSSKKVSGRRAYFCTNCQE